MSTGQQLTPGAGLSRRRLTYDADSLLEVAVRVFEERGYDGTSMSELARAAGISKSSIYHHFAGKESLLRLAVSRALDALFAVLDEEPARTGAASERLQHVVLRTAAVLVEQLPFVTLLLRVRGNTPTERWALDRRREFDRRVAALVSAAAMAGELRADIEPRLATRLIFGMINSVSEWYRPDHGEDPAAIARAVAVITLEGLRSRPR